MKRELGQDIPKSSEIIDGRNGFYNSPPRLNYCHETLEEKLERSREKNREHAKRTRLRKKEMLEGMKMRLLELQREAIRLEETFEESKTVNILAGLGSNNNNNSNDDSKLDISCPQEDRSEKMRIEDSESLGDLTSLDKMKGGNIIDQLRHKVRLEAAAANKNKAKDSSSINSKVFVQPAKPSAPAAAPAAVPLINEKQLINHHCSIVSNTSTECSSNSNSHSHSDSLSNSNNCISSNGSDTNTVSGNNTTNESVGDTSSSVGDDMHQQIPSTNSDPQLERESCSASCEVNCTNTKHDNPNVGKLTERNMHFHDQNNERIENGQQPLTEEEAHHAAAAVVERNNVNDGSEDRQELDEDDLDADDDISDEGGEPNKKERNRLHAKLTRDRKKLFITKIKTTIEMLEKHNKALKEQIEAINNTSNHHNKHPTKGATVTPAEESVKPVSKLLLPSSTAAGNPSDTKTTISPRTAQEMMAAAAAFPAMGLPPIGIPLPLYPSNAAHHHQFPPLTLPHHHPSASSFHPVLPHAHPTGSNSTTSPPPLHPPPLYGFDPAAAHHHWNGDTSKYWNMNAAPYLIPPTRLSNGSFAHCFPNAAGMMEYFPMGPPPFPGYLSMGLPPFTHPNHPYFQQHQQPHPLPIDTTASNVPSNIIPEAEEDEPLRKTAKKYHNTNII